MRKTLWIFFFTVYALTFLAACSRERELYMDICGLWSIDTVTKFEFGGDGKGAMVLPTHRYEFAYKIRSKVISIDFEDENVTDVDYFYTLEGDTLVLEMRKGEDKSIYTLTKE